MYRWWRVSFRGGRSEEGERVLRGYMDYMCRLVVKEWVEKVGNKVEMKREFEKEKVAEDGIKRKNEVDGKIEGVNY